MIDMAHTTGIKEKLTAVRLTQKQFDALAALARKEDRSVAWLIRKAITDMLNAQSKK